MAGPFGPVTVAQGGAPMIPILLLALFVILAAVGVAGFVRKVRAF